jgi:hypothetical protein
MVIDFIYLFIYLLVYLFIWTQKRWTRWQISSQTDHRNKAQAMQFCRRFLTGLGIEGLTAYYY